MFPEIKFSDSIVIPTYLVYLSFLYSFLVFYVSRRADRVEVDRGHAFNIALILMLGGFLGGRLLHVFFEVPQYYKEDWTRVLRVWEGGFVFFGGFAAALIGMLAYTVWKKISFLEWADFYAPVGALGYGLGRISCFLAGCCYGRSCDLPWAVTFSWDPHAVGRHPTQLYAVAWELLLFVALIILERKKIFQGLSGMLFFFWLNFHGVGRLMMEFFRDDFRGDLIAGLTLSTWVSLILIAGGIGGMLIKSRQISES